MGAQMLKQPFFSQITTESAKKALSRMKICNVCRLELNMLNFRRIRDLFCPTVMR